MTYKALAVLIVVDVVAASAYRVHADEETWDPSVSERIAEEAKNFLETDRPKLPLKSDLPDELGRQMLEEAIGADSSMISGRVLITSQRFAHEELQAHRKQTVRTRLEFDKRFNPPLWAQWNSVPGQESLFVRNQKEAYFSLAQHEHDGPLGRRIEKQVLEWVPGVVYCEPFPIDTFHAFPHQMRSAGHPFELFVQRVSQADEMVVEKRNEECLIHLLYGHGDDRKSHVVWWLEDENRVRFRRMAAWGTDTNGNEWKINDGVEVQRKVVDGVPVPVHYLSAAYRSKYGLDAEVIKLEWSEVNVPIEPEYFSMTLFEPKENTRVFDHKVKGEPVIGERYSRADLAVRPKESANRVWWILGGNVLLLLVLASAYFFRRTSRADVPPKT